jgi:hypothetical protein
MTGRSSIRHRVAVLALLVAASPLVGACTIHRSSNGPSQPEPSQGPFASVGTQTIPAAP